jgi:dCMP deaminase
MRPDWKTYWMQVAQLVSTRSTCDRLHVGCVIVSTDNQLLASGFNGSCRGQLHCDDVGHLMDNGHCIRTVHSEVNAIASAAKRGVALDGGTLYVTHSPCWPCAKLLYNAGVAKVVYGEMYKDASHLAWLPWEVEKA